MVGHEQARHHLAIHDVPLHNFRHIGIGLYAVPDTFRVNHHAGTESAMIEAAGLVRAHDVLEVETLGFLFETGMNRLGSEFGAASAWVIRASLIDTDENMSLERGQGSGQACIVVV